MEEFERQCQTNNLVNMLSKEVLMPNMSQSMEYVTVFAQKELFRRIGGGMSVNGSLVRERRNYGRGGAACHGAHGHGEMITNVMEVGEGSSNVAKMRKVRVPRRRGRKKLVK